MPSSVIASMAYEPQAQRLAIRFTSGAAYVYYDVPAETWRKFQAAASKGSFFAAEIRDRYPFRKLAA